MNGSDDIGIEDESIDGSHRHCEIQTSQNSHQSNTYQESTSRRERYLLEHCLHLGEPRVRLSPLRHTPHRMPDVGTLLMWVAEVQSMLVSVTVVKRETARV